MQIALNSRSVYKNQGNSNVLHFLNEGDRKILDIGCGAGDTGSLIRSVYPNVRITGITCSSIERERAMERLDYCICMDIERESLSTLPEKEFDVLLFSHVLEHLVDPIATIEKLLPLLKTGGKVIIFLPNIANWRNRWKLALGKFEYTESGVMDKTHLHFYTFHTAPQYLIEPIAQLKLETHAVNGSIPLAFFRHRILSQGLCKRFDEFGCHWLPNLFGNEIVMLSIKN
jgi:2-polyprenyl-3-methyl-5-hydroxy-6-metoxy-1,4-benzoquinol methylase